MFPGALGDLLLVLPALRAIAERHRPARLTLVVSGHLLALARALAVADVTANLDAAETGALFGDGPLPSWLAGRPVVYSWVGSQDEGLRARITRAARRARFFRVERGAGAEHAAAAYARTVGSGLQGQALVQAARIALPAAPAVDALLGRLRRPVLAVHPGAGAREKRWDAAGFVRVGEWWRQRGGDVVEIAGPAEAGDPLLLGGDAARDLALPDLADLLARVTMYLGNDSGVSHLAGAAGTAGIVLFGPTLAARWRPLTDRLGVLQARKTGPEGITLAALPVARVVGALERRLALTTRNAETSVHGTRLA